MNYYNYNYNNNNNNFLNSQYLSANNIFNSQKTNLNYLNNSRYFSPDILYKSNESYKILPCNNYNFYYNNNSVKSSSNLQNHKNSKSDLDYISLPKISRNRNNLNNSISYNNYNNKYKTYETNNNYKYNFNKYLKSENNNNFKYQNLFINNINNLNIENNKSKLKYFNDQLNNNNNIKTKKFIEKSEYIREYIRYGPEWYRTNNKKIKHLEPSRNIFRTPLYTPRNPNYNNLPSLYTYDFDKKKRLQNKEKNENKIIVRYIANIHSSIYKEKKKKKKKKKIENTKKESDIFLFGIIQGKGEDAQKIDNLSDVYIDGGEEMSYTEPLEDKNNIEKKNNVE